MAHTPEEDKRAVDRTDFDKLFAFRTQLKEMSDELYESGWVQAVVRVDKAVEIIDDILIMGGKMSRDGQVIK